MGAAFEEVLLDGMSLFCMGLTVLSSGRSRGLPAQVERSTVDRSREHGLCFGALGSL